MSTYKNPILYADYSDPDLIRVGDNYYMVSSSFTYLPGVPILHSEDLVHWEIINYAVKSLPFERYSKPCHGAGTWAPSIRYHEGVFFIFIPLPDEGILVARSEDIRGEFKLNMLVETKGWIDPCPFWDEDGKAYMVFAFANSRCGIKHKLALIEMDQEATHVIGNYEILFDGKQVAHTSEGPKLYKRGPWYYILHPAGGVATGWQACQRAKNIHGPYEYKVVMNQGASGVNGPHQGGWVDDVNGNNWFVHFQDVGPLGRIVHLEPLSFVDDWPYIGVDVNGDGIGEPVSEWPMPLENKANYSIAESDEFSCDTLGLQWQWQANPSEKYYKMTGNALRLYCLNEKNLWNAPNVLTQIPQHENLFARAKLILNKRAEGDFAGLAIVGREYEYIGIDGESVSLYSGKEGGEEKLVFSAPYSLGEIYLKVSIVKNKVSFAYSSDGKGYIDIPASFDLRQAVWTGAKLALWATNKERESAGYADYEFFTIDVL